MASCRFCSLERLHKAGLNNNTAALVNPGSRRSALPTFPGIVAPICRTLRAALWSRHLSGVSPHWSMDSCARRRAQAQRLCQLSHRDSCEKVLASLVCMPMLRMSHCR